MNEMVRHEIDVVLAGRVWHFRELFDIEGSPENDRGIAEDMWGRGIRRPHKVFRHLQRIFHDELQGSCLVEEAEGIKERNGVQD